MEASTTSVVVGSQSYDRAADEESGVEKKLTKFTPSTKAFISASNKEQKEALNELTLQLVSNKNILLFAVGLLIIFSAVIIGLPTPSQPKNPTSSPLRALGGGCRIVAGKPTF